MGQLEVPWMMQKYGSRMDRNRQRNRGRDFRNSPPAKLVVEIVRRSFLA